MAKGEMEEYLTAYYSDRVKVARAKGVDPDCEPVPGGYKSPYPTGVSATQMMIAGQDTTFQHMKAYREKMEQLRKNSEAKARMDEAGLLDPERRTNSLASAWLSKYFEERRKGLADLTSISPQMMGEVKSPTDASIRAEVGKIEGYRFIETTYKYPLWVSAPGWQMTDVKPGSVWTIAEDEDEEEIEERLDSLADTFNELFDRITDSDQPLLLEKAIAALTALLDAPEVPDPNRGLVRMPDPDKRWGKW